jgi:Putative bacterial sensory transduction regulator
MIPVDTVRSALNAAEVEFEEPTPGTFAVTLPGTAKLKTTCSLVVGDHGVTVNAFVARRPDENHEEVYRWLLERNLRTYGVAFAIDHLGDIYLAGRIPHESITADEVDRLLGSVLQEADSSFNRILELGFVTAIRKEWAWREKRGEPLTNLAAFAHLAAPRLEGNAQ